MPLYSNVSSHIQTSLRDQTAKPLTLRQGQVILGKVTKLYPNQVATVKFGNHEITAKLEVPLSTEQPFLFEVTSIGELPQFKVHLPTMSTSTLADQVLAILAKLNLSPTKQSQQFIHELLTNQIPFRFSDLKQVLIVLRDQNDQQSRELLLGMLKDQLPINKTTLNSLMATQSTDGLVSRMESLYQTLENQTLLSQFEQQLFDKLAVILNRYQADIEEVTASTSNQAPTKDDLNGHIESGSDDSNSAINHSQTKELNLASDAILNRLNKQMSLSDKQLLQMTKLLAHVTDNQTELNQQNLEQLQSMLKNEEVTNKILKHLPSEHIPVMEEFIQEPTVARLEVILRSLTDLVDQQIPQKHSKETFEWFSKIMQTEPTLFPIKERYLIHMKHFLLNSGLDYEYQLYENTDSIREQPASLKQLLLQVISEQSSLTKETEQLLNLLTGQQLMILKEDASFLHLSTMLPGFFGIEEDIEVEFFSRKDKDQKIDPDYCRVTFYLNLKQIGTTIIDMNVQNRVVQLTVFNDEIVDNSLDQYKGILKEGLAKLNYHLSTISYKPLPEERAGQMQKNEQLQPNFKQSSLDVRI